MQQKVNEVYEPLFTKRPRYFFLMGGRGAGRSTVASQYANAKLIAREYFRCAIMRFILGDIRNSIYREIKDRAEENGIIDNLTINDTTMTIVYGGNLISAMGFHKSSGNQKAKLKSLANYNTIIIEEAEEILEEDFMQLDDSLRTLKGDITIIFLLNPPQKSHWIIQRWFDLLPSKIKGFYIPQLKKEMEDDCIFIQTSYKDNIHNLSKQSVKNYRRYKETKPSHYWNMIKGLVPEVLIGKIYNNWRKCEAVPEEAVLKAKGLDFGYTNDPTALVDIYEWNGGYILDEQLYQKGMKNSEIAKEIGKRKPITVGDSAEPKSIDEIAIHGVNIIGSTKGKGSISQGIDSVQSKKIWVTERSKNIWKEYENYSFVINKDGDITNEPKDIYNHAMDAIRYAISFLNPFVEKDDEEEYQQPDYEKPGIKERPNAHEPIVTIGIKPKHGTSRQELLKRIVGGTAHEEESYETNEPWQKPGL